VFEMFGDIMTIFILGVMAGFLTLYLRARLLDCLRGKIDTGIKDWTCLGRAKDGTYIWEDKEEIIY